MSDELTVQQVQQMIVSRPFHHWLGLEVVALHDDAIEIKAKWREEWVVNPQRRYTHGGISAALIDLAADWALVKRTGRGVPTIDMRVDYPCPRDAGRPDRARQGRANSDASSRPPKASVHRRGRHLAGERPGNLLHRATEDLK